MFLSTCSELEGASDLITMLLTQLSSETRSDGHNCEIQWQPTYQLVVGLSCRVKHYTTSTHMYAQST